jgi:hypothetical protein
MTRMPGLRSSPHATPATPIRLSHGQSSLADCRRNCTDRPDRGISSRRGTFTCAGTLRSGLRPRDERRPGHGDCIRLRAVGRRASGPRGRMIRSHRDLGVALARRWLADPLSVHVRRAPIGLRGPLGVHELLRIGENQPLDHLARRQVARPDAVTPSPRRLRPPGAPSRRVPTRCTTPWFSSTCSPRSSRSSA